MAGTRSVDTLLAMPTESEERAGAWRELTRDAVLCRALHEAVRSPRGHDWASYYERLSQWKSNFIGYRRQPERQVLQMKWDIVYRLVWCAQQAAERGDRYQTEIDRAAVTLGNVPEEIGPHKEWAWGCIRTFLDAPRHGRSVRASVAGWDERTTEGFLATLELQMLGGGAGETFHDPVDAFTTRFDAHFEMSIRQAWTAARRLAAREGVDVTRLEGRFRILARDDHPLPEITDRSASGAAARGWWYALMDKVPDEGVIVLAQVVPAGASEAADDELVFGEVGGVPAKVRAIAADGRFDTIAVAGEDNLREAEQTLRSLGKLGPIRVVNIG